MQLPSHNPEKQPSDVLQHVHPTIESAALVELTPPHTERMESPEYRKVHQFLIHEKDSPCLICGVRTSTLNEPTINVLGSTQLELHHYPIEYSLMNAVDPLKVHKVYPQVYDQKSLEAFIDSPANLLVLCDQCHRSKERGIHHLLVQDWAVLPFLKTGYQIAATKEDEQAALAKDEQIEQAK